MLDGPMLGDQLRQLQCPVVALVQSRSRRGRFGTSGGPCDVGEGAATPGQPRLQTGRDYRGIEQNQGGGEQQLVFGDVFAPIRRSGSPAGSASEESSGYLIAYAEPSAQDRARVFDFAVAGKQSTGCCQVVENA
ncbi:MULTISPECIES: hypothetical protein [Rhodococcus]|uniref:hypothetical protein n=1 Tax=Rhodococcus TaxID=1827 RepID=UPI001F12AB46|nr:hypothetical protein [Rhodococcus qingshengii]ULD45100.1 hypothetical protein JKI97_32225 [Rhodococcus qingshengii]